jgi:hypothetical protein
VFLNEPLLKQEWAQELATRAGTHVVRTPEDIAATTERLTVDAPLSA